MLGQRRGLLPACGEKVPEGRMRGHVPEGGGVILDPFPHHATPELRSDPPPKGRV